MSSSPIRLPASPPKKSRFLPPDSDRGWHSFGHQAAALEFAQPPHQSVWAMEKNGSGARTYVVATREDFWRRYRTLPSTFRHYYELIRAEYPCHLYLDIEYCKRANPEADGEAMMQVLVDELQAQLVALLGADDGGAGDWYRIVDLDSSTPKKFSRHLIVRLHGGATAFATNQDCGRFVHKLCADALRRCPDEPRCAALFVAPPAADEAGPAAPPPQAVPNATTTSAAATAAAATLRVCVVDLTVYSRHRCFRLYKSSKVGKRRELLPAGTSEEDLFFMPHAEEAELFMDSLATNVPDGARLLSVDVDAAADATTAGSSTADSLSSSSSSSSHANVRLPRPPNGQGCSSTGGRGASGGLRSDACPHPALADFVLDAWTRKTGLPARISRWSSDDAPGREAVTLALGPENRWCAHVQRPHRSNGTLLRVDLRGRAFAQFCFDADCRAAGFRGSDWLPVPPELCDAALPPPSAAGDNRHDDGVVVGGSAEVGAPAACSAASTAPSSSWLVSEEALAALPLDEIVSAAQPTPRTQPSSSERTVARGCAASDGPWLSDEVLAAMPMPECGGQVVV